MHRHLDRVSDAYADERIAEKLAPLDEKPKIGFRDVDRELKERGVPAATRLHLVTALVHLGQSAQEKPRSRVPMPRFEGPVGGP